MATAAAAVVPCLAALPRASSLAASNLQKQCRDRARGLGDSNRALQQPIWGANSRSGSKSSNRCYCAPDSIDESFTTNGNVVFFDGQAGELENYISGVQDKLIVLDISTKTCGPCKFIFPKFVKMSQDYPEAIFLKINGDHDSDTRALMRKWKVRAVPTFKFFRNGEQIHSHSGAKEDELRAYFMMHYYTTKVSVQ